MKFVLNGSMKIVIWWVKCESSGKGCCWEGK